MVRLGTCSTAPKLKQNLGPILAPYFPKIGLEQKNMLITRYLYAFIYAIKVVAGFEPE